MIFPIYSFGHSVLRRVAEEIDVDYAELNELIANMWETMYDASGVGLAAPQIGLSIRLFIVDTAQMTREDEEDEEGIKCVFINPVILDESGDQWSYEEGCLSIPKLTGEVERKEKITIEYSDENFSRHKLEFDGLNARVIQHEYDHLEGILFTDRLKPLKRRLIKRRLEQIKKGQVEVSYRMKFKP